MTTQGLTGSRNEPLRLKTQRNKKGGLRWSQELLGIYFAMLLKLQLKSKFKRSNLRKKINVF